MDRGGDMKQQVGLWEIYKTSFRIICIDQKQIFSKIALILILPVSSIFLVFHHILFNLHQTFIGEMVFHKRFDVLSSSDNWVPCPVSGRILCHHLHRCIHSLNQRQHHLEESDEIDSSSFKRLILTFMWVFVGFSLYSLLWFRLVQLYRFRIRDMCEESSSSSLRRVVAISFYIITWIYLDSVVPMAISWQLGSVASVFEDVYGRSALAKRYLLMNGNLLLMGTSQFCFFIIVGFLLPEIALVLCVVLPRVTYGGFTVGILGGGAIWALVVVGILVWLHAPIYLFYLVCKSCLNEDVDKSLLKNHLEGFRVGGCVVHLKSHPPNPANGNRL